MKTNKTKTLKVELSQKEFAEMIEEQTGVQLTQTKIVDVVCAKLFTNFRLKPKILIKVEVECK